MQLNLNDQHAVVVGGAHGIGWAIAQEFAAEGCRVSLVDRDPQTPKLALQLAESPGESQDRFRGWPCDITDPTQVQTCFTQLAQAGGDFQHVVVAAGCGSGKFGFPFWNLQPSDWQPVLAVNLMGTVHVAHACVETLRRQAEGTLTLLASVAGQIGSQTDPPYSAAKAGVINFGQCLAKDLAADGIRVNTICPGMVQTDLNRSVWQAWCDQQPAEKKRSYEDWAGEKVEHVVPLKRWQSPQDIAALAVFLASARGRNITGQTLNVDGGFVMHW